MTSLKDELIQHAATQIEVAFEAGYDEASEKAYNVGFSDGKKAGFNEAVDLIETTRAAFDAAFGDENEDPGDKCGCPECSPEDYDGEPCDCEGCRLEAVEEELDALESTLNVWAPLTDDKIVVLAETVDEALALVQTLTRIVAEQGQKIEALEEQSVADDLVIEALNERLRVTEEILGTPDNDPQPVHRSEFNL